MALMELVKENIVKVPLESADKPDVLRELVQILKDAGQINDYDAVLAAVQEREDQQSTGLEGGFAVPHAKTDAVDCLKLAVNGPFLTEIFGDADASDSLLNGGINFG